MSYGLPVTRRPLTRRQTRPPPKRSRADRENSLKVSMHLGIEHRSICHLGFSIALITEAQYRIHNPLNARAVHVHVRMCPIGPDLESYGDPRPEPPRGETRSSLREICQKGSPLLQFPLSAVPRPHYPYWARTCEQTMLQVQNIRNKPD